MENKKPSLLLVVAVIGGIVIGSVGHWLFTDYIPEQEMQKAAQEQQEKLNQMVRSGKVVSVKANELVVKVEKAGDKESQVGREATTFEINEGTSVQRGMEFLNEPGKPFDITQVLKPGTEVTIMADEEDKALAVYFQGEEQLAPQETQPQPPSQNTKQNVSQPIQVGQPTVR